MLRAAAKNHAGVAVVVDPADYAALLAALEASGGTDGRLRRRLAAKAFARTAAYDAAIAGWLARETGDELPRAPRSLPARAASLLRYGENPHQRAAFYVTGAGPGPGRRHAAPGQGAVVQQPHRRRRGRWRWWPSSPSPRS